MNTPLLNALEAMNGRVSFHMPGHKGRKDVFDPDIVMDVTEIDFTDDLYHPRGAIGLAEALAAKSARACASIFLTNGSTCGVEAMLGYAVRPGQKVIMPRASHLSAVSACALYGLEPVWVDSYADEGGAPFTKPEDVLATIKANPDAVCVLVTRPDYFGRLIPLGEIVKAAHAAGMLMLVDEAHGAHLSWLNANTGIFRPEGQVISPYNTSSAMDAGADICVQSAHKTMGAMTGGALLHCGPNVDALRLLRCVALMQSTSPSFMIMASLDKARAFMDERGEEELKRICDMCDRLYSKASQIEGIMPARDYFNMSCDRTRLALDVSGRGITGIAALKALEAQGVDIEMADLRRMVMITSTADTRESFARLYEALGNLPRGEGEFTAPVISQISRGKKSMSVREAAMGETTRVPLDEAAGRVAARALGVYPPGVPLCVPGEIISEREVDRLRAARSAGLNLFGTEQDMCVVVK